MLLGSGQMAEFLLLKHIIKRSVNLSQLAVFFCFPWQSSICRLFTVYTSHKQVQSFVNIFVLFKGFQDINKMTNLNFFLAKFLNK